MLFQFFCLCLNAEQVFIQVGKTGGYFLSFLEQIFLLPGNSLFFFGDILIASSNWLLSSLLVWICSCISLIFASFSSAGNLYAIAHLGLFAVYPIDSLCFKLFTFITIPSISMLTYLLFSVQYSIMFYYLVYILTYLIIWTYRKS